MEIDAAFQERAVNLISAQVGALWVGPLLAAWFQVMDFYVPGRSAGAVSAKIVMDQVLQGPFMIATMFLC